MKILSFFKKGLKLLLLVVGCLLIPRMMKLSNLRFYEAFSGIICDIAVDDDCFFKEHDMGIYIEKQKLRAERGNIAAMDDLARRAESSSERIHWLSRAAECGAAWSQKELGDYYKERKDMEKAAEWYIKAYQGSYRDFVKDKLFCIGMYFEELAEQSSYVEEKNIGAAKGYLLKAEECYRVLAEGGYDTAMKRLRTVQTKLALENLWWKAVTKKDANAQFKLAEHYFEGYCGEPDYKEAAKWCQEAAEQGHVLAQSNLGYFYRYGHGVEQDDRRAIKWFTKAAEQGYADAQFMLGYYYHRGIGGLRQNEEMAVKWYMKAAKKGHAQAQNEIAAYHLKGFESLMFGISLERNDKAAVDWYKVSAEQGYALAQYNLGCCYAQGIGVEQDREKAIEWYEKAAEQGYAPAREKLEEMRTPKRRRGRVKGTMPKGI